MRKINFATLICVKHSFICVKFKMPVNAKIAVIGGGINGISSALNLINSIEGIDITIIADRWSPNTTGDGSAGLLYPYLVGKTPVDKIKRWFRETSEFFGKYWKSPQAPKLGITLSTLYILTDNEKEEAAPGFSDEFLSYREMTPKELESFPKKFLKGTVITTYGAECRKLLPFLLNEFKSKGGKTIQKKINDIKELAGKYDIVVNCSGVQSSSLVPDPKVHPIRGQVIRVKAPWVKHSMIAGKNYYLVNTDCVVLGGTKQAGDWNLDPDPDDRNHILEGCYDLLPSLRSAEIVNEWVGLRPGREEVRIEVEKLQGNDLKSNLYVVHNYGHGGSGVTLFWGCAQDVLHHVRQLIDTHFLSKMESKL